MRLSAYIESRKDGVSKQKSASIAKNLTVNFNRKGEWQHLSTFYLFANASIQGSTRMLQAMAKSKRGRVIAGSLVASGFFLPMIAAALLGDDDEGQSIYDQIPEFERSNNLIVPTGTKTYVKVPLPYGYSLFYNTGRLVFEAAGGRKTPAQASMSLLNNIVNSFNPLGAEGTPLQMVAPTLADPIVQAYENKDWRGRDIVPLQSPYGYQKPDSQISKKDTTEFAKSMATVMNNLTGGNDIEPGAIDVSPAMIDNWLSWVAGGTGIFINKSQDAIAKVVTGKADELSVNQIPIVNRFAGETPPNTGERELFKFLREDKKQQDTQDAYTNVPQRNAWNKVVGLADKGSTSEMKAALDDFIAKGGQYKQVLPRLRAEHPLDGRPMEQWDDIIAKMTPRQKDAYNKRLERYDRLVKDVGDVLPKRFKYYFAESELERKKNAAVRAKLESGKDNPKWQKEWKAWQERKAPYYGLDADEARRLEKLRELNNRMRKQFGD